MIRSRWDMVYAVSDIQGCYDKYQSILKKIALKDGDTLCVLGDAVDRGPDGVKILLDMMRRPNVRPFWGNHEYIMYSVIGRLGEKLNKKEFQAVKETFDLWMYNGGEPTYKACKSLGDAEMSKLLEYSERFSVHDEIRAGGNVFFCPTRGSAATSPASRSKAIPCPILSKNAWIMKKFISPTNTSSAGIPRPFLSTTDSRAGSTGKIAISP